MQVTRLAKTLAMPPAIGLCALLVLGGCVSEEDPADQVGDSYRAHVTVVAMPICGCCGMVILRILDP